MKLRDILKKILKLKMETSICIKKFLTFQSSNHNKL